jgi:hypothetical protein
VNEHLRRADDETGTAGGACPEVRRQLRGRHAVVDESSTDRPEDPAGGDVEVADPALFLQSHATIHR